MAWHIWVKSMKVKLFVFAVAVLPLLIPSPASAFDKPLPEDTKLVSDCIALAASNDSARGLHPSDEGAEAAGAAGRLAGAALLAPMEAASCIGVVSTKCVQDKNGVDVDGVESGCYSREAAVWDQKLNDNYKQALAALEDDAAANLKKVQKAWIAYRDATCDQPYITFQGSMAGPMEAWCQVDLTARQALWMASWLN